MIQPIRVSPCEHLPRKHINPKHYYLNNNYRATTLISMDGKLISSEKH